MLTSLTTTNMNCPKCGTEIEGSHQYCRSCGAGLKADARSPFNIRAWGILALMLIFGGLLMAMGGKMWAIKWLTFLGLVITFGGMFGIAAFALFRDTRSRHRKGAGGLLVEEPKTLRGDATRKLPALEDTDFVPSVVDDTTELLKTPVLRTSVSEDSK